jgi:hypothetical protein
MSKFIKASWPLNFFLTIDMCCFGADFIQNKLLNLYYRGEVKGIIKKGNKLLRPTVLHLNLKLLLILDNNS